MNPKIDRYWAQFLDTLPDTSERPQCFSDAFFFGASRESASSIAALVLDGTKTATGSLLWVYEAEGKPVPKSGDYNIVTDAEGEPLCIIQDVEIDIIPFDEVDQLMKLISPLPGFVVKTIEPWRVGD
jgi:uncharacterized protein YhfF